MGDGIIHNLWPVTYLLCQNQMISKGSSSLASVASYTLC